jgi:hypothetical protein
MANHALDAKHQARQLLTGFRDTDPTLQRASSSAAPRPARPAPTLITLQSEAPATPMPLEPLDDGPAPHGPRVRLVGCPA